MGLDMELKNSRDETVATWRKANQIRGWLVSHEIIQYDDDCVDRIITKKQIKELVNDCKKVLENHDLAKELLPTTDGFFFGSQKYDEWYFKDLQSTVEKLSPLLEQIDENYIYHDWW
jgi:hypothetical protein